MRKFLLVLAAVLGAALFAATPARADGCYICTQGSDCGQYCRYRGSDTQENRKKCQAAKCKIGGTASCPTAANIRICSAGLPSPLDELRQLARGD